MKKNKVNNIAFIDSMLVNNQTYIDYLERFKKIALSMFEWVNLPESCNQRYLEECLYYKNSKLAKHPELVKLNNYTPKLKKIKPEVDYSVELAYLNKIIKGKHKDITKGSLYFNSNHSQPRGTICTIRIKNHSFYKHVK